MIAAFSKTLSQLADPRFQKVMWRGLGGAALIYLGLLVVLWWLLSSTSLLAWSWVPTWLENLVDSAVGFAVFGLSLFVFPAIVSVVVGIFLEDVALAVEVKFYPDREPPREQKPGEIIWDTIRFALITIGLNILASPFYLFFFFFPPIALFIFYLLNGYLFSREYFELVGQRRLNPGEVRILREAHVGYLWLGGVALTFLLTIPVLNMFAPILATAFMVHMFENLRRRKGGPGQHSGGNGGAVARAGNTSVKTNS